MRVLSYSFFVLSVMGLFFMPVVEASAKLPKDIKWVTNTDEKPFSSEKAKQGGIYRTFMTSYPLTFRLYGPNSNDSFAGWNRTNCMYFALVERHPYTLKPIPGLATHWAVMPDQKTIYYKLDPDVKWRDGKPVTADDYVFGYNMMLSKHLKDPYYNKYFKENFEAVEKVDKYTLKVVGAYASWRAIFEFQITPEPKHSIKLDESWVKRTNWKEPNCVGPYYIYSSKKGRYVRFKRLKDWWGDKKKYYKNRYNFDYLDIKVIRDPKMALEHFKKGDLTAYQVRTASWWANDTDFDAVKKGWVVKRRVFTKSPEGKYGIVMNLKNPMFQDQNFRKALQHLFDFDKINKNLMYNAYTRMVSFFGGTEYENSKLKSYQYDPVRAKDLLKKAGWTKRGSDGILVNDKGERCSFVLTYGSNGLTRHLSVYKEDLKTAGVEMLFRLVDGAKAFKDGLEKNFQALLFSRSGGLYPSPEQYLHTDYAKVKDNNNVFSFGMKKVDDLMQIYKKELDLEKRKKAMWEIDQIIKEHAFYIPFWTGSFTRVLFWNNLGHIDDYEPLYSSSFNGDWTWWFDKEKDKALKKIKKSKKEIAGVNKTVDLDPHNLGKL